LFFIINTAFTIQWSKGFLSVSIVPLGAAVQIAQLSVLELPDKSCAQ
jgi:hypothetical protein